MIHTIRILVENTDSLYEKIVQCQKAGKYKLLLKNIVQNLLHFLLFSKTYNQYPIVAKKPQTQTTKTQQPNNKKPHTHKKRDCCNVGTSSRREKTFQIIEIKDSLNYILDLEIASILYMDSSLLV